MTKKNKLYEDSIFNLIVNDKKNGRTREKTKEEISQIFSLDGQMAEERMKKYCIGLPFVRKKRENIEIFLSWQLRNKKKN